MIRVDEKLTILFSDNNSFSDLSDILANFRRDNISLSIVSSEDYIYIGFEKPINTFYMELVSSSESDVGLNLEYYNETAWMPVVGLDDDTKGFSRSGFVRWDRNQENESKSTVNSVEQYFYRVSFDTDIATLDLRGLGIVFSDDEDLKERVFEIDKYLPQDETSHILSHVAAKKEIIQQLRVDGRYKQNLNDGRYKDISSFDLLDISQVNEASKLLTLAIIFFSCSDADDDIYMTKSKHFRTLYNIAMKTFYLNLDTDDDGISDRHEEMASNNPSLFRR